MNQFVFFGRLVRDPELRTSGAGKVYALFSLALDRRSSTGEATDFFDCVCFGRTAEALAQYKRKGDQIIASGECRQDRWQDEHGQSKSKVKFLATSVTFVANGQRQAQQPAQSGYDARDEASMIDDIPF